MKHVWPTRLDGVTSYQFQRYLVADQGSAQCVKLPIDFCRQLSSLFSTFPNTIFLPSSMYMYPIRRDNSLSRDRAPDFCRQLSSLLKNAHVSMYHDTIRPCSFHVSDSTR